MFIGAVGEKRDVFFHFRSAMKKLKFPLKGLPRSISQVTVELQHIKKEGTRW
jgi:hypothetical protein